MTKGLSEMIAVPSDVKNAAKTGLLMQKKFHQGTASRRAKGIARANQLTKKTHIPLRDVRDIYNYFQRHEGDRKGANFHNDKDPSPGRIAWQLWGSNPIENEAWFWSRRELQKRNLI